MFKESKYSFISFSTDDFFIELLNDLISDLKFFPLLFEFCFGHEFILRHSISLISSNPGNYTI